MVSLILAIVAIALSVAALTLSVTGLINASIPMPTVPPRSAPVEDLSGLVTHPCGCIEQAVRIPEQKAPVGRFQVQTCDGHVAARMS